MSTAGTSNDAGRQQSSFVSSPIEIPLLGDNENVRSLFNNIQCMMHITFSCNFHFLSSSH